MADHTFDEAKGRVKEAVGDLKDDDELKESGRNDQREAELKEKVDEAGDKVKGAIDDVADRLR